MTDSNASDRDVNRAIRSWLHEDRHEDASRVAGAVLDQVEATPGRRATWWPARRTPTMNKIVGLGLGAAAVVLALVIGAQLLGSSGPGGVGTQTSADPSATAAPSSAEPSSSADGDLPVGAHVLYDGELIDGQIGTPITVTIPAPAWYGEPAGGILVKNDNPKAPDGAGLIGPFVGELYVYGDPCQWASTRPDSSSATVDEFVAALAAQASRDASEPVDITVDGYAGKSITLHVPDDADFTDCDRGTFGSWGVPGPDLTPFRYHQDPGQIDVVWAVDVDGALTVIDWSYYDGTPQAVRDELEAIVDSITFEAP